MKNILLCFFLLQVASCHFGTVEYKPEATKCSIKNNSSVQLFDVRWNGTNFGDINSGEVSEREVSEQEISNESFVFFLASNGKQYNNYYPSVVKKHKRNEFPFIDETLVVDNATSNRILLRDVLNAD